MSYTPEDRSSLAMTLEDCGLRAHCHNITASHQIKMSEPTKDAPVSAPGAAEPVEGAAAPAEGAPAGPSKSELKKQAKAAEKAKKAAERAAREEEERKKREAAAAQDNASQNYGKLPLHQSSERLGAYSQGSRIGC